MLHLFKKWGKKWVLAFSYINDFLNIWMSTQETNNRNYLFCCRGRKQQMGDWGEGSFCYVQF